MNGQLLSKLENFINSLSANACIRDLKANVSLALNEEHTFPLERSYE